MDELLIRRNPQDAAVYAHSEPAARAQPRPAAARIDTTEADPERASQHAHQHVAASRRQAQNRRSIEHTDVMSRGVRVDKHSPHRAERAR
jgi:hypothetical protein